MARLTHKIQITASTGGQSRPISGYVVETGSYFNSIDLNVPANAKNMPFSLSFSRSSLQSFVAWSDKGCGLTINTQNGPLTVDLQPGWPFIWLISDGDPPPFAGDVTDGDVTSTAATRLRIDALVE